MDNKKQAALSWVPPQPVEKGSKNGIISTGDKRANEWVLKAAADAGYLDTEAIFVDSTHIKASANLNKQARKAVSKEAKR